MPLALLGVKLDMDPPPEAKDFADEEDGAPEPPVAKGLIAAVAALLDKGREAEPRVAGGLGGRRAGRFTGEVSGESNAGARPGNWRTAGVARALAGTLSGSERRTWLVRKGRGGFILGEVMPKDTRPRIWG